MKIELTHEDGSKSEHDALEVATTFPGKKGERRVSLRVEGKYFRVRLDGHQVLVFSIKAPKMDHRP